MAFSHAFREAVTFTQRYRALILARLLFEPLLAVFGDFAAREAGMSPWASTMVNLMFMLISVVSIHGARRFVRVS
jgi:hypothetical protein